jgi:hypothetical protein
MSSVDARNGEAQDRDNDESGHTSSRGSRFRFKSKRKSDKKVDDEDFYGTKRQRRSRSEETDQDPEKNRRRHRRHHHSQSSKRQRLDEEVNQNPSQPAVDDPAAYDDTYIPNTSSSQYRDPNVAFRESLFDAMADDEGAAFWEGVYGQPIHTYPQEREGPDGELERMTDEEYTAYVRARMYEKTHQHLLEEKARREKVRQKEKEEREARANARRQREPYGSKYERSAFDNTVEESLRRGEERRKRKRRKERWVEYQRQWEELKNAGEGQAADGRETQKKARQLIPWPVDSAKMADVHRKEEVEKFFAGGPDADVGALAVDALGQILKMERVRWHPDKIQQRLGHLGLDQTTLAAVTAVFQVVDNMWADRKGAK